MNTTHKRATALCALRKLPTVAKRYLNHPGFTRHFRAYKLGQWMCHEQAIYGRVQDRSGQAGN